MIESPYLNTKEASRYLGITLTAFYKLRTRRHVRTHRLGRSLRFKRVDLDRLFDEEPVIALARKRA